MMVEIGNNIRELRKGKNMTQKDLAKILNVTPQAVSKWERNESNPDIQTLLSLSKYFNVSVDEILGKKSKSFFETLFGRKKGGNTVGKIADSMTSNVVVDQNGRKKVFIFDITAVLSMEQATPHTQHLVRKLDALMKKKNENIEVRGYTSAQIDKLGGKADVIMLAPVYAYAKEEIEEKFPGTPVITISKRDYGITNVELFYYQIMELLK